MKKEAFHKTISLHRKQVAKAGIRHMEADVPHWQRMLPVLLKVERIHTGGKFTPPVFLRH
jgi:hypothetical protein